MSIIAMLPSAVPIAMIFSKVVFQDTAVKGQSFFLKIPLKNKENSFLKNIKFEDIRKKPINIRTTRRFGSSNIP